MIKRFTCHNFRNIETENLEFERINILIGPNNSGKTNFIKAITFFSEMLKCSDEGNLKSAFLNAVARNGWERMLYNRAEANAPIDFSWDLDLNGKTVQYRFSCGVGHAVENCNILLEELNGEKTPYYDNAFNYFQCHDNKIGEGVFSTALKKGRLNSRLKFNLSSQDTLMMQFKDILLGDKSLYASDLIRQDIADLLYRIQEYFEGFYVYTSAQFNSRKMREPVGTKNLDEFLNHDASNFVNLFNRYKSKDMRWKQLFEERMRELIPDLQMADVVTAYDKLIFKMIYHDEECDLSAMSEGTLKGLILNFLINMPMEKECSLLAIDEPEMNLHPAWQKVVGNWFLTTGTFKQCFISTHSPDFLDAFTEEFQRGRVAVFVFDQGASQLIKKITYDDIADELGDWELGDLYRTNDPALGGWAVVDRIACFFTCGYTESGAMQVFLGKINPQYEFKQYLPNKTRKRKGDPKSIAADLSGLSGNSLLEKIYAVLDLPVCKKEIMQCKAILIEDDLDGKFHGWSEKMIREYQDKITVAVCSHLGKEIPVILLYASPEIEAWFVADWDNSFQYMLLNGGWGADITREAREYFNYQLRHYVNVSILREYTDQIEEYGYFDGKYYKLSDQLICAIERNAKDYVVEITRQNSGSEGLADQIKSSRTLYYSKKTHGQRMLKNIDPRLVASKCRRYFRPVYNELLVFNNR